MREIILSIALPKDFVPQLPQPARLLYYYQYIQFIMSWTEAMFREILVLDPMMEEASLVLQPH